MISSEIRVSVAVRWQGRENANITPSSLLIHMSASDHLEGQCIHIVPSFKLENGTQLHQVPVAYKTWGNLNETRDNVMIICHAFTGSADVEDWCVASFYGALSMSIPE